MKLYLDDIRFPPNGFHLCRTAQEAMDWLGSGVVTFISFDHDLGTELTGYSVACYIEKSVFEGKFICPGWCVHSANPIGADNIDRAMMSASRF